MGVIDKRNFVGLDQDTTDRLLPVGSYRYALNCHVSTSDGDNVGAVENVMGNELVTFALPPGNNKCIGTYEDRVGDSIIFLVSNSASDDVILQFFINDLTIIELMKADFGFQDDVLITGAALEDNLFYWTDGVNPQRKINIQKARSDKGLITHLHFQFEPAPLVAYTLLIKDVNGLTVENSIVFTVPGPQNATLKELTTGITNGINALGQSPTVFEAFNKGTYVELEMKVPGYYEITFTATGGFTAMAVYENMYQRPIRESYFDMLKYPPNFPPLLFKENNPAFKDVNEADKRFFEFRLRYIYDDGERSALGPVSKLPPGEFPFNGTKDEFYKVVYKDSRLSSVEELCIIRSVELIFRQGNIGTWKTVGVIERSEIVGNDGTFFFMNNEEYAAISTKDGDKPYDSLPILSNSISLMNNYAFLDAKVEGYDPIAPDVVISLKINNEVPFLSTNDRGSFLRRPGFYKWALVYFDRGNRTATVSTDPSMHLAIPGYAEDLNNIRYVEAGSPGVRHGTVEMNWKVQHRPPEWATHWGWARTLDSVANNFLVARVTASQYLQADRVTGTSYGASNARYIKLTFGHWSSFNDTEPDADHGWTFVEGDRMRFLKSNATTWYPTIEVTDVVEATTSTSFIVSNESGFPNIVAGSIVQFYSPGKPVENDLYFEIGEFYEVGNPHQPNRYHRGQIFDQDPNNPFTIPAEGTFEEGDNYRIVGREWGSTIDLIIDSPRADQRYKDRLDSYNVGRVNVFAPNIGQALRGHTVRNSNKRFVGTNINGYSTFDSLDATDLQKNYGDIQRLERIDNILLSLHTREAVSLYIEENIYTDVAGNPTVTVSDKVIGNDRVLRGGFGTDNPESFVLQDSRGYWFCTNKGQYVRYGGDGLTPISDNAMSRYFHKKGKQITEYGGTVFSTYDVFHGKVIVAFSKISYMEAAEEIIVSEPETLAFDERSNRWTSFFSFHPENMEKLNTQFVTFLNGNLYLHSVNAIHNNFYNTQYTSQIRPVFNMEPSKEKVYQGISIEATDLWVPIELTTPEGQKSSLTAQDFELLENIFYAPILCDENTPNVTNPITQGDAMRSALLHVLLENSNTQKSVLYFANVEGVLSFLSNTG